MAYDEQLALDTESKRETARLELVKRVAELEAALRAIDEKALAIVNDERHFTHERTGARMVRMVIREKMIELGIS